MSAKDRMYWDGWFTGIIICSVLWFCLASYHEISLKKQIRELDSVCVERANND